MTQSVGAPCIASHLVGYNSSRKAHYRIHVARFRFVDGAGRFFAQQQPGIIAGIAPPAVQLYIFSCYGAHHLHAALHNEKRRQTYVRRRLS